MLTPLAAPFMSSSWPILLILGLISTFASYIIFSPRQIFSSLAPKQARDQYPILGALRYFSARWDFFQDAIAESKTGSFSFYIGKYGAVGLSGKRARKDFFESKDLSFRAGTSLTSRVPKPPRLIQGGKSVQGSDGFNDYFNRRINRMLSRDNFGKYIPAMIHDTQSCLLLFGPSGTTNPFTSINRLVFQITVRSLGCNDIANDPALLDKTSNIYETMEHSYNPYIIIFPWLVKMLTPSFAKQSIAGTRLFYILKGIIEERKRTGKREDDTMQYLMDQGDAPGKIIGFIISALFAGVVNSGINAAWFLCYLATSPNWTSQIRTEVLNAVSKYSSISNSTANLSDRLASLPLQAWENDVPMLDLCLEETIRVQGQGVFQRRNVSGEDVVVGGEVVPNGAFALYHIADAHRDESIYKDPESWDPARYLADRNEGTNKFDYLGWGIGRHPCPGMRFAKLEIKLIVAFFLATYDFSLIDKQGETVVKPPLVNRNNMQTSSPDKPLFLKYELRV